MPEGHENYRLEMGNLSYSKQPPSVVFVQTVEHADGNPYSKTNTVSTLDLHEWSSCSKEFAKRGFKVIRFAAEEIADLEFRKKNLLSIHTPVVGSRRSLKICLRHLSVLSESESLPELRTYPVALRSFLKRRVKETTFEEVKTLYDSLPNFKAFIKPRGSEYVKMWTGCVINSKDDLWKLTNVEDSTPVYVSEPVAFLAEYRCYVICGSLKAVSCYVGDEKKAPLDLKIVYTAIRHLEGKGRQINNSPITGMREASRAYAIDFGVSKYVDESGEESQRTTLVEVNDGFSLGLYPGCSAKIYTDVLLERWYELVGLKRSPTTLNKRNSCAGQYGNEYNDGSRSCHGEYE